MNSADQKTSPLLKTAAFNNINNSNANHYNMTAEDGNILSLNMAMTMSPNQSIND